MIKFLIYATYVLLSILWSFIGYFLITQGVSTWQQGDKKGALVFFGFFAYCVLAWVLLVIL